MLAKLRKRFILITMGLVGVVLIAVLAVSVAGSFQTQFALIQDSTAMAVGEGGNMKPWLGGGRGGGGGGGGGGFGGPGGQLGSAPSQPVFLVVVDNSTGWLIDQDNASAMDEAVLTAALERVSASTGDSGFLGDLGLYFQRQFHDDGPTPVTRIAFADTSQLFATTLQQAGIAALIFVGAMLVFFFISLFLSKFALRPVKQAWEQQRQFVADASHELKTPLTVILANNNIMLAHPEKSTSEQTQWLQSTQEEAQRMDGLVRDLLLMAQVEEQQDLASDKQGLGRVVAFGDAGAAGRAGGGAGAEGSADGSDAASLDFSALIERGLLQFDAVFFERGIELESDIEPDIKIKGNEEQLGRLVAILLDNASKYSADKGTVSVRLTGSDSADQNKKRHATLKVSNTGEQIAPDKIAHLFERFYRGDTSHSNAIEGNGLGLSLAQAIVEAHGGQITVTNEPTVANAKTNTAPDTYTTTFQVII